MVEPSNCFLPRPGSHRPLATYMTQQQALDQIRRRSLLYRLVFRCNAFFVNKTFGNGAIDNVKGELRINYGRVAGKSSFIPYNIIKVQEKRHGVLRTGKVCEVVRYY